MPTVEEVSAVGKSMEDFRLPNFRELSAHSGTVSGSYIKYLDDEHTHRQLDNINVPILLSLDENIY